MMAVAEFLENVDMAALGLDNTDKVLRLVSLFHLPEMKLRCYFTSTAELTPILSSRSPMSAETPLAPSDGAVAALRGRVEQQVDAIADSANKVISGVVDSSFGILRSFMPAAHSAALSASSGRTTPGTPGRSSLGLLRRESGFSIASLAASLPIAGRSRAGTAASSEEAGQQMMSVSRPVSRASAKVSVKGYEEGSDNEEEDDDDDDDDGESESSKEESEEEDAENKADEPERVLSGDGRSVKSFESMLSASRGRKGAGNQQKQQPRKTLSDRLASMSALATSNLKVCQL